MAELVRLFSTSSWVEELGVCKLKLYPLLKTCASARSQRDSNYKVKSIINKIRPNLQMNFHKISPTTSVNCLKRGCPCEWAPGRGGGARNLFQFQNNATIVPVRIVQSNAMFMLFILWF